MQPLDNFYKATGTRDGLRGDCKGCFKARAAARYRANPEPAKARARQWSRDNPERVAERVRRYRASGRRKQNDRRSYLKRNYGISVEQYDALLAAQGGVCALCEKPPRSDIALHVDHDHATGRIRGLLCFRCNNALGDLGDDPDRMVAAAVYLGPRPKEPALVRRLAELKRSAA